MKNALIPILLTGLLISGCAPKKTEVRPIPNGVELALADLTVRVQFYADNTIRATKRPAGREAAERPSFCVVRGPASGLDIRTEDKGGSIVLRSEAASVKISKSDGRVEFLGPDGRVRLAEKGGPGFEPAVYSGDTAFHVRQDFRMSKKDGVYGLGQHQDGLMNYRGHTVTLAQSNTEASTPVFVSTGGTGVLWDNASRTVFSFPGGKASIESDFGDCADYYVFLAKDMDGVIAAYRDITGAAPMYGKWAYGYWQSREHYDNRDQLMTIAEEYRRRRIPIDNIVQDWDYWNGAANWGGMFFDPVLFPRPKEMVDRLHKMNYHMMISIWPALGPNTAIHKDMAANGFLYTPVGWAGFKYYDAFNPAANDLYWKYLRAGLVSTGIDAWWIDSTEPDVVNALTKPSSEYELKKMGSNHAGSWARTLNAFSLVMTDAVYAKLKAETDRKRPYILTRSTFAGQQRNAATTWSGDIGANWDVYRRQISAGLNHCMAGIPYWTFDIGAFVIGAYGGVFSKGGKDPAYQELYTRMFQFGAFCPIFRSHGSETPREIWEMGEFADILVEYDNLRYRLLPYIYSLAWKVTADGYTMMRGLAMDFPADVRTHAIDDQFMFGPAFMACPVTEYMLHKPPEPTVPVPPECFLTPDGKRGLKAQYYKDAQYRTLGLERTDPDVDVFWYTGRPDYVTDSTFAIRWTGKLVPQEEGVHQFHLKSFDAKRLILDGREVPVVYTSTEQYTALVDMKAGEPMDFVLETENRSTGAARMQLFWKTPKMFGRELEPEERKKTRSVYLPAGCGWTDFWTGETAAGGVEIETDAPIGKMPVFIRAGSIVPMGPFIQYSDEKPADPLEIRIYPGADGSFTLYEDENDNQNYTRGVYATIDFTWDDAGHKLTVSGRKGSFPGMLKERTFKVVLVGEDHGTGVDVTPEPDRTVRFDGKEQVIRL
jgi:alpha-D-xyloside xylohydrolase